MQSSLTFEQAFNIYILHQKVIAWGFQQQQRIKMPDGFYTFTCGYYTEFENGYKLMASGESLGQTPVQEALIINPDGIPIARDTEDIRPFEF